jgi:uncharacterized protein with GYD domain
MLMKLTDQGIKTIKDAPRRAEAGIKALEQRASAIIRRQVLVFLK